MQDRLFIRMLTGDDLQVEAPIPLQWKGRTARALFALLALQPGEPVLRDLLAVRLWPDHQAARGSLRMALLSLRRVIDPVFPDMIRATNESIMLDVEREAVDWVLFENLCKRPDVDSRIEALELYKGDLELSAVFPSPQEALTELLRNKCEQLRETAIRTGVDLIAEFDITGPTDRIGFVARKVLTIEPANEPAHRAMMRAHARAGDRSAVLRQYEQCYRVLDELYGLGPSEETIALKNEVIGAVAPGPAEPSVQSGMSARNETTSLAQPLVQGKGPGRRRFLVAAFVLVPLGWAAIEFWPCASNPYCIDESPLPVIVLSLEFDEADRHVAEIVDKIRAAFEKTLGRIAGAIVITQTVPVPELTNLLEDSYAVDATIERSGKGLRIYVDLRDGGSKAIADKYQYNIDVQALGGLADRLEADLIPALRSRIGLDQRSK
ncbi:MAG: bacterial transcriptional activator domain-containing protein [Alphaproteobacteria bacterium]|nr:bacterial transcriptional activator domain-containing protein [Alphaproteobacteria bacterium]